MQNARVTDPVSLTTSLQGNLQVKGVELGVTGHVTDRLEIVAGYTYLDARTVASLTPGADRSARSPTPPITNSICEGMYEFAEQFSVGGGLNAIGPRDPPIRRARPISPAMSPSTGR